MEQTWKESAFVRGEVGVTTAIEFSAMHTWMTAYVDRHDRDGWPSPELERCAKMVQSCLWSCANNDPLPAPIAKLLETYTKELAAAQAAARGEQTP